MASRHSKAANDAYLRGDHLSAQEYSQKSREEWMVAKRLNEKAAKEIMSIRNSKNDQWTLDLHGLHSAEAVTALQEHLSKIETQVPIDQLVCTNGVKNKSRIVSCGHSLSANCCEIEKLGIRPKSSKPTSLQVITGNITPAINSSIWRLSHYSSFRCKFIVEVINHFTGRGNHSRGEAALPSAIRSFLIGNG